MKIKMKASDFEIDFSGGGLFTCCYDFVLNNDSPAKLGMVLTCEHCEAKMRLEKCDDGILRWRSMK